MGTSPSTNATQPLGTVLVPHHTDAVAGQGAEDGGRGQTPGSPPCVEDGAVGTAASSAATQELAHWPDHRRAGPEFCVLLCARNTPGRESGAHPLPARQQPSRPCRPEKTEVVREREAWGLWGCEASEDPRDSAQERVRGARGPGDPFSWRRRAAAFERSRAENFARTEVLSSRFRLQPGQPPEQRRRGRWEVGRGSRTKVPSSARRPAHIPSRPHTRNQRRPDILPVGLGPRETKGAAD